MHIFFTDLKYRSEEGGGGLLEVLMVAQRDGLDGCGGFQIYNKTNSGLQQVVDSPQCGGVVSCTW